ANRLLLLEAGVLPQRIEIAGICTRCHASDWFSYRAAGPRSGAQAAVIALPLDHVGEG
ncbi:MAG: laccase domain-containing protein, partial [Thermomicrobium sp.]